MESKLSVVMTTWNDEEVTVEGITSEDGTLFAAAIAKPGNPAYQVKSSGLPGRTNVYGDVAVYSYDSKNERPGMLIMPSRSWMVMQSKTKEGSEQLPFIRGPWDVKTQTTSQSGSMKPMMFSSSIRKLCISAIEKSVAGLKVQISSNNVVSEELTMLAKDSIDIALMISSKKKSSPQQSNESISEGKTAADLLG